MKVIYKKNKLKKDDKKSDEKGNIDKNKKVYSADNPPDAYKRKRKGFLKRFG